MRQHYLETKVTTASQAELQLMLLEGALRHGTAARDAMLDEDQVIAYTAANDKLLAILETLVQGAATAQHELSQSVADQFSFLFREAVSAHVNSDKQKLGRVLELIAYHRDTWRLACDGLRKDKTSAAPSPVAPHFAQNEQAPVKLSLQA